MAGRAGGGGDGRGRGGGGGDGCGGGEGPLDAGLVEVVARDDARHLRKIMVKTSPAKNNVPAKHKWSNRHLPSINGQTVTGSK